VKRRISLMILAGLVFGLAEASAEPISTIPLMVCADGITQTYNGLLVADTLSRVDYDILVNSNCTTPVTDTVTGNNGSFNLSLGTSSFQLCYSASAGGLPKKVCDTTGCSDTTCSFRVRQLDTNGGKQAFGIGDCVSVVCSGSSPQSWGLVSAATLTFS
jgi:hypothetical protein